MDPEKAKQIAEDKCLLSAAKSLGVHLKVESKSVQTLNGADQSESIQTSPIVGQIKCGWEKLFTEKLKDSFRVWLKCKIIKTDIETKIDNTALTSNQNIDIPKSTADGNSVIRLLIAPLPDRILIENISLGTRIIERPEQNKVIEIKKGDLNLIIKKQSYKDYVIDLNDNKDGSSTVKTVTMLKEI
jgi:hypothetical protein